MKKTKDMINNDAYKVIISELGVKPFSVIKCAFALIGMIPFLVIFYLILGKNFHYDLFLGNNAVIVAAAIFISIIGFLYAYSLVKSLLFKLLFYSYERKRSDDEKAELLISVSHDLKTPLTTVNTGLQNIFDGITGPVNETQARMIRICIDTTNKMVGFVNELLDASKTDFYRTNLKRGFVDFKKIVEDEINGISELAKKNKQDVQVNILAADLNIWGDRQKLSRAVMNLLSNAVKYTPADGRIKVVLSADEKTVKFLIINTGYGIMPDEIDKIFNKYQRLARHSEVEGTGLGLSIARDIIDLHNGHMTVRSEPHRETEFSVVLPRDLRTKER